MAETGLEHELKLAETELQDLLAEGAPDFLINPARARVAELRSRLRPAAPPAGTLTPQLGCWAALPLYEDEDDPGPGPGPEDETPPAMAATASPSSALAEEALRLRLHEVLTSEAYVLRRSSRRRRRRVLFELATEYRGLMGAARLIAAGLSSLPNAGRYHEHLARLTGNPVRAPADREQPTLIKLTDPEGGTELPFARDGLTQTARIIVGALLELAPASGPRRSFSVVHQHLREEHPQLTPTAIAHTINRLARQRLAVVEHDGATTKLTALGEDFLRGRLAAPLLLANGIATEDVYFPPLGVAEVIDAALCLLDAPAVRLDRAHLFQHLGTPHHHFGALHRSDGLLTLWTTGESELQSSAVTFLEADRTSLRGRVVVVGFPLPALIPDFLLRFEARRAQGEFDGVDTVRPEGDCVVIEVEHRVFVESIAHELELSGLLDWRFAARLRVRDDAGEVLTMSVTDALELFVRTELARVTDVPDAKYVALSKAASEAEARYVALRLLEPVLNAMRPSHEDEEAVHALMHFLQPEHRAVLDTLPYPPSHAYRTGFTEPQARYLLSQRKLRARSVDFALQDWAKAREALAELQRPNAEPALAAARLREELLVARLRLFRAAPQPKRGSTELD